MRGHCCTFTELADQLSQRFQITNIVSLVRILLRWHWQGIYEQQLLLREGSRSACKGCLGKLCVQFQKHNCTISFWFKAASIL